MLSTSPAVLKESLPAEPRRSRRGKGIFIVPSPAPAGPKTWAFNYIYAPRIEEVNQHWRLRDGSTTALELFVRIGWDVKGKTKCVTWEPFENFEGQSESATFW